MASLWEMVDFKMSFSLPSCASISLRPSMDFWRLNWGQRASLRWTHAYSRLVLGLVDVPVQEQRLDLLGAGLQCQQNSIKIVSLKLTL
jgi:hypothetical protein